MADARKKLEAKRFAGQEASGLTDFVFRPVHDEGARQLDAVFFELAADKSVSVFATGPSGVIAGGELRSKWLRWMPDSELSRLRLHGQDLTSAICVGGISIGTINLPV